jgi:hypothetical protein
VKYTIGGVTVKTGEATKVELPARRLRSSIWMGDPGDVLGGWADRKTGKLARDPSKVSSRTGVLDDLTLLTTIHMSKDRGVAWRNDNVVPLFSEALTLCHDNKIELYAGYTIADEGTAQGTRSKLFVEWIRNPVNPTPAEHAAAIVKFLWDDKKLDFDGIGFDLELNGLKGSDKSVFIDFYGHLADLLKPRRKVLSIATGIGDIGKEDQALGTFVAQPFEIAKGHDNVIMRPMCYDVFNFSDEKLEQWRAHVADYALNTVGLKPSQFQLGLKTSNNSDIFTPKGQPLPPGWGPRKCCLDASGVADFCKKHLRPKQVGVITFAGFTDSRTIDASLNPSGPPAGTSGEPLQQPIP